MGSDSRKGHGRHFTAGGSLRGPVSEGEPAPQDRNCSGCQKTYYLDVVNSPGTCMQGGQPVYCAGRPGELTKLGPSFSCAWQGTTPAGDYVVSTVLQPGTGGLWHLTLRCTRCPWEQEYVKLQPSLCPNGNYTLPPEPPEQTRNDNMPDHADVLLDLPGPPPVVTLF